MSQNVLSIPHCGIAYLPQEEVENFFNKLEELIPLCVYPEEQKETIYEVLNSEFILHCKTTFRGEDQSIQEANVTLKVEKVMLSRLMGNSTVEFPKPSKEIAPVLGLAHEAISRMFLDIIAFGYFVQAKDGEGRMWLLLVSRDSTYNCISYRIKQKITDN